MDLNISPIIRFFLIEGVPFETIILILMLPIIATLIAFLRQVVGIKAFGIYTPLIITFAFLATNGLRYGVAIFLAVIFIGMLMRFILKPFRLLYLPRVAIMLTVVAVLILLLLVFGGNLRRTGLASVSIFPILIMITLVEKFVAVQIEKGNKTALILAFETLVISVAGFYIASWGALIKLLVAYPWVILFTIPFNVMIGRWTGLRVSEYIRFKDIIKKL
ncbi:MAG: 7TM domain-containing protein [Candidatus Moranbacteria bacterium]|nr:7TM domain-containing protein [bacterium]MDP1833852.1 7TM domain-containing protein [Candidatus Moranbacteria bacterium]